MAASLFFLVALNLLVRPTAGLRTVVLAPCGTDVGTTFLQMARRRPDVAIRALASDEDEAAAARMRACGASLRDGCVSDLCASSFPRLETVVARAAAATRAAVADAACVVVLTDDAHPRLRPLAGDAVVEPACAAAAAACAARSRRVVDAAVAARVPHVVLLSCLDAASLPEALAGRTGGVAASRRDLEARLHASGTRHTVIRAPPIAASDAQLRDIDAGAAAATGHPPPPLVARHALARALLNAALDTTNARRGVYEIASLRGPAGHYGAPRRRVR